MDPEMPAPTGAMDAEVVAMLGTQPGYREVVRTHPRLDRQTPGSAGPERSMADRRHVTPVGPGTGPPGPRAGSGARATCGLPGMVQQPTGEDGVLRAATAQLWFSTVHPFEDGDGLFARAITGKSQNSPMGTACRTR